MEIATLIKIRNNPYYYNYLRENSSWYKLLNRDINNFSLFDEEVKEFYKLNLSDKLIDVSNKIDLIKDIMDIII